MTKKPGTIFWVFGLNLSQCGSLGIKPSLLTYTWSFKDHIYPVLHLLLVSELEGEGATVNLNEENAEIELEIGRGYTFRNTVASNHPLEFRNSDGDVLLAQGSEEGSFENNIAVNFTRDGDEDVTFTLTPALAAEIAIYRCTPHASMEGPITVVE